MKIFNTCIFLMSLLVFITSLSAQDVRLVDLSGFYAEEIQIAGFTLDSDQTRPYHRGVTIVNFILHTPGF